MPRTCLAAPPSRILTATSPLSPNQPLPCIDLKSLLARTGRAGRPPHPTTCSHALTQPCPDTHQSPWSIWGAPHMCTHSNTPTHMHRGSPGIRRALYTYARMRTRTRTHTQKHIHTHTCTDTHMHARIPYTHQGFWYICRALYVSADHRYAERPYVHICLKRVCLRPCTSQAARRGSDLRCCQVMLLTCRISRRTQPCCRELQPDRQQDVGQGARVPDTEHCNRAHGFTQLRKNGRGESGARQG